MEYFERLPKRLAVVGSLLDKTEGKILGRTQIMKLLYLLQTVKDLPLGYKFTLYTYGPFDSDVLSDLDYGEVLNALTCQVVQMGRGYMHEVRSDDEMVQMHIQARDFLTEYNEEINWVMEHFGEKSATDLELISTIVFVDRDMVKKNKSSTVDEIAESVHKIKPRFPEDKIKESIETVKRLNLLKSTE